MQVIERLAVDSALRRILSSHAFHRQAGLQRFLHFVVTETPNGRASGLSAILRREWGLHAVRVDPGLASAARCAQ